MFIKSIVVGLSLSVSGLVFAAGTAASANVAPEALTLKAADGVSVFGALYRAEHPKAVLLLFHQAGSNRAEYSSIAPRLVQQGFNVLAVDQRSGGKLFGRTNQTVAALGKSTSYLEASKDLEAALSWAADQKLPVGVWGSSYSAALVFQLAAAHPAEIKVVLAFSPGEYLGKPDLVQTAATKVAAPIFATSSIDAEEIASAKTILAVSPSTAKTQFIPRTGGVHGSSTLREDRNAKGSAENWAAVLAFLNANF